MLASATFDAHTEGGVGSGLAAWFGAALDGPLRDLMAEDRQGIGASYAGTQADGCASRLDFSPVSAQWPAMGAELLRAPETAHVRFHRERSRKPVAHVRSSSIIVRRPNVEASLLFDEAGAAADDPAFCARAVGFLVAALDGVGPAFARLGADEEPRVEHTGLDLVLGRKAKRSVAQARTFLRGYSWTTVCPAELTERLGGAEELRASGAFHSVVPLTAGGVVLQATATVAEFSDEALRQVFEALRPVLPPGTPRPDPAHPELRFIDEDAVGTGS
ncbi:hypothetical protein [Streptomyces sp. NPDC054842]